MDDDLYEGLDETEVEFLEGKETPESSRFPMTHWSYSSLMTYLRNPLAWYKRYVEHVYDIPVTPSSIVGRACHVALQHFFGGIAKDGAIDLGLEYLRDVPDFEINFSKAKSRREKKRKRELMEREYLQAISFYLERPPRYDVLGVEVKGVAKVEGLPLPIKAISDLVAVSKGDKKAVDIIDHKFVDYFSPYKKNKTLFVVQAIFNYYTVKEQFKKPVQRFIVHECKKRKNFDGSPQVRKHVINFSDCKEEFTIFNRLLADATNEITRTRVFLPNPSDLFEGENSFDIYRLGLGNST